VAYGCTDGSEVGRSVTAVVQVSHQPTLTNSTDQSISLQVLIQQQLQLGGGVE